MPGHDTDRSNGSGGPSLHRHRILAGYHRLTIPCRVRPSDHGTAFGLVDWSPSSHIRSSSSSSFLLEHRCIRAHQAGSIRCSPRHPAAVPVGSTWSQYSALSPPTTSSTAPPNFHAPQPRISSLLDPELMPNAKSVTHCRDNSAAAMVVEATRSEATLVRDDSAGIGSVLSLSGWQSQVHGRSGFMKGGRLIWHLKS
jgi:hypothetical protein